MAAEIYSEAKQDSKKFSDQAAILLHQLYHNLASAVLHGFAFGTLVERQWPILLIAGK
jgi:hypothetical protein